MDEMTRTQNNASLFNLATDMVRVQATGVQEGILIGQREAEPLRERIAILEATLRGIRGMAETEATLNHSNAWAAAVALIDEMLK